MLAWGWLTLGTIVIAIPIAWAVLSSLKTEAEINAFPPSLIPQAAQEIAVEGQDEPLPGWVWTDANGQERTVGLVRRIGLAATVIDPARPGEPFQVPVAESASSRKCTSSGRTTPSRSSGSTF